MSRLAIRNCSIENHTLTPRESPRVSATGRSRLIGVTECDGDTTAGTTTGATAKTGAKMTGGLP